MNTITLAPVRPHSPGTATDHRLPDQPAAVDQKVAAALLELDFDVAGRQGRRIGRQTRITAYRKELAATKRANRSTLNEIAASLGVSRSTLNRMFEEPAGRGGRSSVEGGGDELRHDHGTGRRRHAGAGVRREGPLHR